MCAAQINGAPLPLLPPPRASARSAWLTSSNVRYALYCIRIADPLLLQPQVCTGQVRIQRLFISCQLRKFDNAGFCSRNSELTESLKCCGVHQQRDNLREQRAQPGENLEALCIEIAPVPDWAGMEPRQFAQQFDLKAAAEDCDCVWQRR